MKHDILDIIAKKSPHISWIKDKTMFLTIHGSRAYNTFLATSDYDYKAVCIPPKEYFYSSMYKFEQAELKNPDPDTTIFEIRKFFNLASANNPSVLEVLFTDEEHHLTVSNLGKELLNNRDKFLSTRVYHSFGGYAFAQMKRIKLHRGYLLNPPKKYPTRADMGLPEQTLIPQDQLAAADADIRKELEKFTFDFLDNIDEATKIAIKTTMGNMLAELKITTDDQWLSAARKIGLSDNFIEIMQKERAYKNLKSQYDKYQDWKNNRNPERAAMEEKFGYDGKHALHLIRLLRMSCEILYNGKVQVKRPDREELLSIRNGAWTYEELVEHAECITKKSEELYKTSKLPKTPDLKFLDSLCISLVEKSLSQ